MTLHSLLGLQGNFCSKDKEDKPLQVDFLIVDEASMVDMWLAHQLFTRLQKDTKLLLLGDVDQLESVGAGNVFAELIGSGIVPVTVLDEIFRQSKDSLIAYNAKFINEGNTKLYYGQDFVSWQATIRRKPLNELLPATAGRSRKVGLTGCRFCRLSARTARPLRNSSTKRSAKWSTRSFRRGRNQNRRQGIQGQ